MPTVISDEYFQKSELRRRSFRFGGVKATSPQIVWPILFLLSLNVSSTGITVGQRSLPSLLGVSFFALICAGFYFTILGWGINRTVPHLSNLRTWLIAFLFATTELIRAISVQFFALYAGLETNPEWIFRIVASSTTGLLIFALASTVVNDSDSYRKSYRALFAQRLMLQSLVEASLDNLKKFRDQLINTTREQLTQALRSTLSETEKKSPKYPLIIQNLFSVAEDFVRPMSHSLFKNPQALLENKIEALPPRVPLRTIADQSSIVAPFRPGLILFMALVLSLPAALLTPTPIYIFQWLLGILFLFVSTEIARRFLTKHLSSIPLVPRIVIISLVYAIPAFVYVALVKEQPFFHTSLLSMTQIYGAILGIVLGWLIASSAGMRAARLKLLSEINQINEELAWQNARLQSELWLDQKNLALTLHNDVQATLLAAALKLKSAVESGSQDARELLPSIRDLISRSINFSSQEHLPQSLNAVVERINNNWAGLITMKYTASSELLVAIESDPLILGVLEDVLSEFQNNSLKHGHATETTAIMTMPQPSILRVAMTNNGSKINTEIPGGLGSSFIKSVAVDYKFENFSRGVKLTVTLPLSD